MVALRMLKPVEALISLFYPPICTICAADVGPSEYLCGDCNAKAARIGLIRTMVYTHLPSNILLLLVPLMPNLPLAIVVLLLRFSLSQMDVPTRQSYVMSVVEPDERSAAAGGILSGPPRPPGARADFGNRPEHFRTGNQMKQKAIVKMPAPDGGKIAGGLPEMLRISAALSAAFLTAANAPPPSSEG